MSSRQPRTRETKTECTPHCTESSHCNVPDAESGPNEGSPLLAEQAKPQPQHVLIDADNAVGKLLETAGCGLFDAVLLLVCSVALSSCTIAIYCIGYVIPVAEGELRLDGVGKAALDSSTFAGMLLGLVFGVMADAFGRKKSLCFALLLNGASGLCSAFMPELIGFAIFRFFCGIGIDCIPVIFTYFSEFFTAKLRGPFVIGISISWTFVGAYAPLLAWVLLSNPCLVDTHLGSMPFRTWRVYIMLCSTPALLSAVLFIFMPESPSWLHSVGKYADVKSTIALKAKVNGWLFCCRKRKVNLDYSTLWPDDGSINTSINNVSAKDQSVNSSVSETNGAKEHCCGSYRLPGKMKDVPRKLCSLFSRRYIRSTIPLLVAASMLSFGYYGLQLWLPVYFNNLLKNETVNGTTGGCSVVGENCTQLDSSCSQVYLDSLLVSASGIPGTILGILTINIVGGRAQITTSMVLSGLSVFFIWWVPPSQTTSLALSIVYNGISTVGWNAMNILQVEYFDADVRSTGCGLLNSCARFFIVGTNFLFGAFEATNPTLPILIVAVCLFVGGIAPLFLPLSKQRSWLGKLGINLRGALCRRIKRARSH